MTRRCGCDEDGDETVFGPCGRCSPKPESVHGANLQAELDRLERPYETTLDADERSGR